MLIAAVRTADELRPGGAACYLGGLVLVLAVGVAVGSGAVGPPLPRPHR